VSTGFDIARELASGLDDRHAAWRFIRGFAANWLTPLTDDDGCTDAELDAAEARLGVRLPAALREAYGLFGRRHDLTSSEDTFLGPAGLYLADTGDALIFRVGCQDVAHWGVLVADLDKADPPVVMRIMLRDDRDEAWQPWLASLSSTCMEMVLSESLYAEEGLGDDKEQGDDETRRLEQRYTRLALPEYPTPEVGEVAVRWFTGPDVVLREDQEGFLWARARTVAALRAVRRDLPGYWLVAGGE
jgi:hypothetical protein